MNESEVVTRLFNAFKNSHIFKTIKTGRVTLNGATYGDYTEMGKVIDPKSKSPLAVAEEFFDTHKKAAKELRTRIAQWRKENIKSDPVKVLYIDGACADSLELKEFSLAAILDDSDVSEIEAARADNFMSAATNIEVRDRLDQTIVTYFDHDGAAQFYIGTDFTGPRDIS